MVSWTSPNPPLSFRATSAQRSAKRVRCRPIPAVRPARRSSSSRPTGASEASRKATGAPDGVLNVSTNAFFSSVRNGAKTFAPKVKYDRLAGRWFIIAATDAIPGRIVIASSNASTITATTLWSFFAFDNSFPAARTALSIRRPSASTTRRSTSASCSSAINGATYAGTSGYVVRKTSVIDCATIAVTAFHNLTGAPAGAGPFAPMGVDNDDPRRWQRAIFIGVDNASLGTLMLRRVSNPGVTPTISGQHLDRRRVADRRADHGAAPREPGLDKRPARRRGRSPDVGQPGQRPLVDGAHDRRDAYRGGERLRQPQRRALVRDRIADHDAVGGAVRDPVLERRLGQLRPAQLLGAVDRDVDDADARSSDSAPRARASSSTPAWPSASPPTAPGRCAPRSFTRRQRRVQPARRPGSPTRGRRWGGMSSTVVDGCDGSTIWTLRSSPMRSTLTDWQSAGPLDLALPRRSASSVAHSERGGVDQPHGDGDVERRHGLRRSWRRIPVPAVRAHSRRHRQQRDADEPTTATVNVSTVGAAPGLKAITMVNPDAQSASSGSILRVLPGALVSLESPRGGCRGTAARGTRLGSRRRGDERHGRGRRARLGLSRGGQSGVSRRRRPTACPARTWERFTARSSPRRGSACARLRCLPVRRVSIVVYAHSSVVRHVQRHGDGGRHAGGQRRALRGHRHTSEQRHCGRGSGGDRLGPRRCGRRERLTYTDRLLLVRPA